MRTAREIEQRPTTDLVYYDGGAGTEKDGRFVYYVADVLFVYDP